MMIWFSGRTTFEYVDIDRCIAIYRFSSFQYTSKLQELLPGLYPYTKCEEIVQFRFVSSKRVDRANSQEFLRAVQAAVRNLSITSK